MTDYSELILLLRQTRASLLGTFDEDIYVNCQEAAHVIETQAKRIADLQKVLSKADEKMERLEQYMDRIQNLIAFFHADIQVAICKDKK